MRMNESYIPHTTVFVFVRLWRDVRRRSRRFKVKVESELWCAFKTIEWVVWGWLETLTGYHAAYQIAFILRTVGANAILNSSNEFQPASSSSSSFSAHHRVHVHGKQYINVLFRVLCLCRLPCQTHFPGSDKRLWWIIYIWIVGNHVKEHCKVI